MTTAHYAGRVLDAALVSGDVAELLVAADALAEAGDGCAEAFCRWYAARRLDPYPSDRGLAWFWDRMEDESLSDYFIGNWEVERAVFGHMPHETYGLTARSRTRTRLKARRNLLAGFRAAWAEGWRPDRGWWPDA
jgi:hypothetical protein